MINSARLVPSLDLPSSSDNSRSGSAFPITRWSLVLQAQNESPEALSDLCQAYWFPLYGFSRRLGHRPADAEDLTQAFFERLLTTDGLKHARQQRGRLRSFLMVSLKNFTHEQWRKHHRVKRGGGTDAIPLDTVGAEDRLSLEACEHLSPEAEFDLHWAREVLNQAFQEFEEACRADGQESVFRAIRHQFLVGDFPARTYREVAEELGVSEASARFMAFKLRQRYKECIMSTIMETVSSQTEANEEFKYLYSLLASSEA